MCPKAAIEAPLAFIKDEKVREETGRALRAIPREALPGLIATIAHPIQSSEDLIATYERLYAPLLEGDSGEFRRRLAEPGSGGALGPVLDLAIVGPAASRLAGGAARRGAFGPVQKALLRSERPELQIGLGPGSRRRQRASRRWLKRNIQFLRDAARAEDAKAAKGKAATARGEEDRQLAEQVEVPEAVVNRKRKTIRRPSEGFASNLPAVVAPRRAASRKVRQAFDTAQAKGRSIVGREHLSVKYLKALEAATKDMTKEQRDALVATLQLGFSTTDAESFIKRIEQRIRFIREERGKQAREKALEQGEEAEDSLGVLDELEGEAPADAFKTHVPEDIQALGMATPEQVVHKLDLKWDADQILEEIEKRWDDPNKLPQLWALLPPEAFKGNEIGVPGETVDYGSKMDAKIAFDQMVNARIKHLEGEEQEVGAVELGDDHPGAREFNQMAAEDLRIVDPEDKYPLMGVEAIWDDPAAIRGSIDDVLAGEDNDALAGALSVLDNESLDALMSALESRHTYLVSKQEPALKGTIGPGQPAGGGGPRNPFLRLLVSNGIDPTEVSAPSKRRFAAIGANWNNPHKLELQRKALLDEEKAGVPSYENASGELVDVEQLLKERITRLESKEAGVPASRLEHNEEIRHLEGLIEAAKAGRIHRGDYSAKVEELRRIQSEVEERNTNLATKGLTGERLSQSELRILKPWIEFIVRRDNEVREGGTGRSDAAGKADRDTGRVLLPPFRSDDFDGPEFSRYIERVVRDMDPRANRATEGDRLSAGEGQATKDIVSGGQYGDAVSVQVALQDPEFANVDARIRNLVISIGSHGQGAMRRLFSTDRENHEDLRARLGLQVLSEEDIQAAQALMQEITQHSLKRRGVGDTVTVWRIPKKADRDKPDAIDPDRVRPYEFALRPWRSGEGKSSGIPSEPPHDARAYVVKREDILVDVPAFNNTHVDEQGVFIRGSDVEPTGPTTKVGMENLFEAAHRELGLERPSYVPSERRFQQRFGLYTVGGSQGEPAYRRYGGELFRTGRQDLRPLLLEQSVLKGLKAGVKMKLVSEIAAKNGLPLHTPARKAVIDYMRARGKLDAIQRSAFSGRQTDLRKVLASADIDEQFEYLWRHRMIDPYHIAAALIDRPDFDSDQEFAEFTARLDSFEPQQQGKGEWRFDDERLNKMSAFIQKEAPGQPPLLRAVFDALKAEREVYRQLQPLGEPTHVHRLSGPLQTLRIWDNETIRKLFTDRDFSPGEISRDLSKAERKTAQKQIYRRTQESLKKGRGLPARVLVYRVGPVDPDSTAPQSFSLDPTKLGYYTLRGQRQVEVYEVPREAILADMNAFFHEAGSSITPDIDSEQAQAFAGRPEMPWQDSPFPVARPEETEVLIHPGSVRSSAPRRRPTRSFVMQCRSERRCHCEN